MNVAVVYLMGQSNCWGQGSFHSQVTDPQYDTTPPNVFIWNKLAGSHPHAPEGDGTFVPLTTGFGFQNPPGSNADAIGCELQLVHVLRQRYDEPIYVIKCARGGTSLSPDPNRFEWSPLKTGELYDIWRDHYHAPAIELIRAQGNTPQCVGVAWCQGAADASINAPPGAADNYRQNLETLIQRVRADVGNPGVPFAIQRETNLDPALFPGLDLVRDAQTTVGKNDPLVATFNSDTRTLPNGRLAFEKHDGEHLTGNGQVDLGNGAGAQLLRLVGPNGPNVIAPL
ncbi:MAG: sialate O-acetylesterase [bacterium]|nr:sialate O-acetylesterase [bacterium]